MFDEISLVVTGSTGGAVSFTLLKEGFSHGCFFL